MILQLGNGVNDDQGESGMSWFGSVAAKLSAVMNSK
jgi:hypothetical protein